MLRPKRPSRSGDVFRKRYQSLAEALRTSIKDPELRRLLDEAAAE
jgi:hypothetical protein